MTLLRAAAIVPLLLTAACQRDPLAGAAAPSDLGPPDDFTVIDCDALTAQMAGLIAMHSRCAVDVDCHFVPAWCCGAGANRTLSVELVGAIQRQLIDGFCPAVRCIDCVGEPSHGACLQGTCALGQPAGDGGAPGGSCEQDGDCWSGSCLTDPAYPGWVDGYCTSSCSRGPCEAGATCHMGIDPQFPDFAHCLVDCDPRAPSPCRTGYRCCWGGGPMPPLGYCAAAASKLCP